MVDTRPKSLNLNVINHNDLEIHDIVMTNKNVEERNVRAVLARRANCEPPEILLHNTIREMVQSRNNVKPRSTNPVALFMFGLHAENGVQIFNAVTDAGCSEMVALNAVPGNFLEAVKVEQSVIEVCGGKTLTSPTFAVLLRHRKKELYRFSVHYTTIAPSD